MLKKRVIASFPVCINAVVSDRSPKLWEIMGTDNSIEEIKAFNFVH